MIARSYWTGVLETFDPIMILEESRWEEGLSIREGRAITYRSRNTPFT